jgi:hypothetical protein
MGVMWLASRPGSFNFMDITMSSHWVEYGVGYRIGLDSVEEIKYLP